MTAYSFKDWFLGRPVPELTKFSKDERRRIWRRYCRQSFRKWQTWAALLICSTCSALGFLIGKFSAAHFFGAHFYGLTIGAFIGGCVGGGVGGGIFGWVATKVIRTLIREDFNSF